MTPRERVERALADAGMRRGPSGTWQCPAHEDRTPSLAVSAGDDGRALLKCFAGCPTDRVVSALGLTMRDLFSDRADHAAGTPQPAQSTARVETIGEPMGEQVAALIASRRLSRGDVLARVGAKRVRCWGDEWLAFPALGGSWKCWALDSQGRERKDADGRLIRRNAGAVSLLAFPSRGPAERLYDVEGESDALACIDAGATHVIASTGGASTLKGHERWKEMLLAPPPKEVAVVGDLDDAGAKGADARAAWWRSHDVPVRLVRLPDDLGPGGDVRDYLLGRPARGDEPVQEPRGGFADLDALADSAPLIAPEPRGPIDLGANEEDAAAAQRPLALPDAARRGSFSDFLDYLAPISGASPAHGFAAWWAVLSVAIGARRWGTWSGRVVPLTYCVAVGPTADHKTTAIDTALALLPADRITLISGAASDAGLFDELAAAPDRPALLHFDELGFLFRMASYQGSTLDAMIRTLWGAPTFFDRTLSKQRSGAGARRLERPFVSIIGGIHPRTFWQTLGNDSLALASGFVNRFALFVVEDSNSLPITAEPDVAVAARLREHLDSLFALPSGPVTLTESARRLFSEFSEDHNASVRALDYEEAEATKRVRDHVARLALVLAVDAGRTQVICEDLTAAIEVGAYLEAGARRLLLNRQAERGPARAASLEKTALALLRKRPNVWHAVRDLVRAWPGDRPSSAELRRVLDALDDVERETPPGGRQPRYRMPDTRHPTRNPAKNNVSNVGCRVPSGGARAE